MSFDPDEITLTGNCNVVNGRLVFDSSVAYEKVSEYLPASDAGGDWLHPPPKLIFGPGDTRGIPRELFTIEEYTEGAHRYGRFIFNVDEYNDADDIVKQNLTEAYNQNPPIPITITVRFVATRLFGIIKVFFQK